MLRLFLSIFIRCRLLKLKLNKNINPICAIWLNFFPYAKTFLTIYVDYKFVNIGPKRVAFSFMVDFAKYVVSNYNFIEQLFGTHCI